VKTKSRAFREAEFRQIFPEEASRGGRTLLDLSANQNICRDILFLSWISSKGERIGPDAYNAAAFLK